MSEERRKLWIYLYPDEPHQQAAIEAIEAIPQRQRPDYFRDSLVAGIAMSKLDKRLPSLLALLLDDEGSIGTLTQILRLTVPEFDVGDHKDGTSLVAVAWQKRAKDVLQQGQPWSAWFAIGKDEYEKLQHAPEVDVQVRALLAPDEASLISKNESVPIAVPLDTAPLSETLNNAKKMFGAAQS